MRANIRVAHAWGMTETSPIATATYENSDWDDLDFDTQVTVKSMQGQAQFGAEVGVVDLDVLTRVLPRDGTSAGALQVRGPWVVKRYFKAQQDAAAGPDQWFDTATDRTKGVIKSGGEWISSVELENTAVGYPAVAVAEAAAIGIAHPK